MLNVAAGTPLTLISGSGSIMMRATESAELSHGWGIPVLVIVSTPLEFEDTGLIHGDLEWDVQGAAVTVPSVLCVEDGRYMVRAATGHSEHVQRRSAVRANVQLTVRATEESTLNKGGLAPVCFEGTTLSLSGGGFSAVRDAPANATSRLTAVGEEWAQLVQETHTEDRWYVEITTADGKLVPAKVQVIEYTGRIVRAKFVEILEADREALIRLVFEQQRAEILEMRFRPEE